MTKTLLVGKMELLLAEVSGVGAIVANGHVRAVFAKRSGWVTRENDPDKWDKALDLVSVRVMRGEPEPEKPKRVVKRRTRKVPVEIET